MLSCHDDPGDVLQATMASCHDDPGDVLQATMASCHDDPGDVLQATMASCHDDPGDACINVVLRTSVPDQGYDCVMPSSDVGSGGGGGAEV